ncbi:MAG TPA: GNAT family N-acetyltransferase [Terriglobales bacterium]|nr:GNAT family N-acetyltransferase [Terriglobales bacterium]
MEIRIAEVADAEDITNVINAAFRRAESFFIEGDRIDSGKVCDLLKAGEFLAAFDGNTLVGCVYVERRGERAYLGLLAVDPLRQASGLGSRLMTAAEEHCKKLGCGFIDLQIVNLRRELPEFYRRRGYVQTGTAPFTAGLATKIPCHFVKMTKSLDGNSEVKSPKANR